MNDPTIRAFTFEHRIVKISSVLQFLKDVGDYSNLFRDLLVDAMEDEYGVLTPIKVPLCLVEGDSFTSLVSQIAKNTNDTNSDSPLNLLIDALEQVGIWGSFHVNIANAN